MEIHEITQCNLIIQEILRRFVEQLTGKKGEVKYNHIEEIISDNNSHLFLAKNNQGKHVGMITIGFYITPTGKKSWIEDVLVDKAFRGKGIGKTLVEFAIQFAKKQNAATIMLTSNPTRISANKLYQKLGFKPKETNVYLMKIKNIS